MASISIWEIAQLVTRGRVTVDGTVADWTTDAIERTGVGILEISPAIAELSTVFGADFPRDPADRMIAATARAEGAKLITADLRIHESPLVDCIW
jgi:PIN domain nuclease of toxin-antitoxin system